MEDVALRELPASIIPLDWQVAQAEGWCAQLSEFVDQVPVGAIVADVNGRIVHMNHAARAVCDVRDARMVGRSLEELWGWLGWPPVPGSVDVQGRTIAVRDYMFGGQGDAPPVVVRLLRDTHDDARAERPSRNDRRGCVEDRLSEVSHTVRNALAGIELFASILGRRVANDADQSRIADSLMVSVRSFNQLLNNLLFFVRPRELQWGNVDVPHMIRQVEASMAPMIARHRLAFRWSVDDDAGTLEGDAVLLQHACVNVVANACVSAPPSSTITVAGRCVSASWRARRAGAHEACVALSVTDEGAGVDPGLHARLADPFYACERGGLGLGLTVAQDIVQAHRGQCRIQSREGQGATVTMTIPRYRRQV